MVVKLDIVAYSTSLILYYSLTSKYCKMKNVVLISVVVLTSLAASAQDTGQSPPKNEKKEYSFLWGVFKSKNYPKSKSIVVEAETKEIKQSLSEPAFDTAKYEQKSILWGVIQWTEKKKNNQPVKSQGNER